MRIVLSIGAAAILAACSASSTPPGGTCQTQANSELSALQGAIQASEQSIENGYSVVRQVSADGAQIQQVQVPVNVAKERQNLANLQARLAPTQAKANDALALCGS